MKPERMKNRVTAVQPLVRRFVRGRGRLCLCANPAPKWYSTTCVAARNRTPVSAGNGVRCRVSGTAAAGCGAVDCAVMIPVPGETGRNAGRDDWSAVTK